MCSNKSTFVGIQAFMDITNLLHKRICEQESSRGSDIIGPVH